jgi:HD superfamily phosphohydrolase YqeK
MSTPTLRLITADDDSADVLAAAEDAVRAGIVHDYWTAIDKGDRLAAWTARYLAEQIDASTPHGPRLLDELAHGPIAA